MKIIECQQGSPEWFEARKGIPTASRFSKILTPKTLKLSASADDLICELIGERMSLIPPEGADAFMNRAMRWGTECEAEARAWYAMEADMDVRQVGFVLTDDGRIGASPDGLVGDDGGLELKCPQASTQVAYLLAGELPAEYKAQVHGALIVTNRKWWDFLSYHPGLPPLLIRVFPDEYTVVLMEALDHFYARYQAALARVRGMEPKNTMEAA